MPSGYELIRIDLKDTHHAIGTSYFNARIAELETRLASLGSSRAGR